MQSIDVRIKRESEDCSYKIHLGSGILGAIGELVGANNFSKIFVVADRNVESYVSKLRSSLNVAAERIHLTAPGEECKTSAQLEALWRAFIKAGLDRKSLVINLGGGAVGDLGGFAAATYMRGIKFVQVPTTLLAQVDASIGGKVAINSAGIKNLVGSFAQPHAVIIDIETLKTLPPRELNSGFAEIVKHGLISDHAYFESLTSDANPLSNITAVIARSCEIKAAVVEKDEREAGLRKILNFGHTIGHALESLSHKKNTPLLHGEAIALGMLAEAKLSQIAGKLPVEAIKQIEDTLIRFNLPTKTALAKSTSEIVQLAAADKKNSAGRMKWTLLESIGHAVWDIETEAGSTEEALRQILK